MIDVERASEHRQARKLLRRTETANPAAELRGNEVRANRVAEGGDSNLGLCRGRGIPGVLERGQSRNASSLLRGPRVRIPVPPATSHVRTASTWRTIGRRALPARMPSRRIVISPVRPGSGVGLSPRGSRCSGARGGSDDRAAVLGYGRFYDRRSTCSARRAPTEVSRNSYARSTMSSSDVVRANIAFASIKNASRVGSCGKCRLIRTSTAR
jgi:hypothetical protein